MALGDARGGRRVLIISHGREVGGAEVYLRNLAHYLADNAADRWRVQLICRSDRILDAWAADLAAAGCEVFRLDVTRPRHLARMAGLMRRATVVHLNLAFPSGKYQFTAALLARSLGRPLIVTHQLALKVPRRWHVAMRWLGRAAWRHIAISQRTRSFLIDEFAYSPDRVVVIHHGVDVGLFRPATTARRATLRQAIGEQLDGCQWGEDVRFTCTVARLSPQKGLFELVEAAQVVARAVPDVRMVVIGQGELHERLANDVRARGLEKSLFLAGALPSPRIAEWLAACDLFILPSHYEGGPAIALMEAMACGCAAVATAVGGVEELVTDDGLARLVPARAAGALAAAAIKLLNDPSARASMGERARGRVMSDFTIAKSMELTVAALDDAAAGHRG